MGKQFLIEKALENERENKNYWNAKFWWIISDEWINQNLISLWFWTDFWTFWFVWGFERFYRSHLIKQNEFDLFADGYPISCCSFHVPPSSKNLLNLYRRILLQITEIYIFMHNNIYLQV